MWYCYETFEGKCWVDARCNKCKRYIKPGKISLDWAGHVHTKDWTRSQHGEVDPNEIHWGSYDDELLVDDENTM